MTIPQPKKTDDNEDEEENDGLTEDEDHGLEKGKGHKDCHHHERPTKIMSTACCRCNTTCAICLDGVEEAQTYKVLPCDHAFHASCIDAWLRKQACCPVCKRELPSVASALTPTPEQ